MLLCVVALPCKQHATELTFQIYAYCLVYVCIVLFGGYAIGM